MSLPTRVTRGQAINPFETLTRDFDVLSRFLGGREVGERPVPYPVDVREDADHLYVEAELPGFKKEEIDLTLENQTLTITAQRNEASNENRRGDLLVNERRHHRFIRSFNLPPTIDEKGVNAKLADGVLTIVLDKREETKARKIQVA